MFPEIHYIYSMSPLKGMNLACDPLEVKTIGDLQEHPTPISKILEFH
jgi:hypothetical protein